VIFTPEKLSEIRLKYLQLRTITNSSRYYIYNIIRKQESIHVTEICRISNLSQPIVSQNISTLRKANLVETNQIDKFVYYSTNNFEIQKLIIYSQSISNKETKTDSKELSENYVLLREAYCFLKSILNPGRLSVLEILNRSGELSVNQISAKTQLGQSIVSQHLSNLKTSNLVFSKKLGKQVLYKTNIEKINSLF